MTLLGGHGGRGGRGACGAHGGQRQSLVPIFNLALFVAQFVAQGCNNHVFSWLKLTACVLGSAQVNGSS